MTIKRISFVNNYGQIRYDRTYGEDNSGYNYETVIYKCLKRSGVKCSFLTYNDTTYVSKRYGHLLIIASVDEDENEFNVLQGLNLICEALTQLYPKGVKEVDFIYSLDWVSRLLDELILNGNFIESCMKKALNPVKVLHENQNAISTTLDF